MRHYTPTVNHLCAMLNIDRDKAKLIRALAKACDDPEKLGDLISEHCSHTDQAMRQSYAPRPLESGSRDWIMAAINEITECCGVEAMSTEDSDDPTGLTYCNTGDLYCPTIFYSAESDALRVCSLADVMGDRS
ncbi:MAG: hypothetical protein JKY94_16870 [Rhodobacteraceae bacterium]|nr:hypothetical protein [Paracoccaceae bacterium]